MTRDEAIKLSETKGTCILVHLCNSVHNSWYLTNHIHQEREMKYL